MGIYSIKKVAQKNDKVRCSKSKERNDIGRSLLTVAHSVNKKKTAGCTIILNLMLQAVYLSSSFLSQDRDGVGVGIRKPYLRVVGIQVDTEGPGRSSGAPLNPLEEEEFNRFASRPDAFETLAKSIAPFIYGSEDVKKAIACLLFGGSRKRCEK